MGLQTRVYFLFLTCLLELLIKNLSLSILEYQSVLFDNSARCPKEQIQRGHADVAERRAG